MQRILSILFYPLIALVVLLLKILPKRPFHYYPVLDKLFVKLGVYPVLHHYYNPFVIPGKDFDEQKYIKPRLLTSIDLDPQAQLSLLRSFDYQKELLQIEIQQDEDKSRYSFKNDTYTAGDAEMYYNMIRLFQPKQIIEIGSGNSTKMALEAKMKNKQQNNDCNITCIEPYEMPWLENTGLKIMRQKVELIDLNFFKQLQENDILFIDSSHVIRPEGDVLYEYLDILPSLNKGVIIHIHDVFTPFHYPLEWIKERRMWNEQYLVEAFLSYNQSFKILLANHYLLNFYKDEFLQACPVLKKNKNNGVGSLWIRKNM